MPAFVVEALELTALEETEQRGTEEAAKAETLVSQQETLRLGRA